MTQQQTVERIANELEIRGLIAELAHAADDADLESYSLLFTEDASWGGGGQPIRKGRAEILEGARARRDLGLSGPGVASRHVVTTTTIKIETTSDRAQASSVFHFYVDTDTQAPRLAALGVYRDTFRKTEDGWRLAERLLEGEARNLPGKQT